MDLIASLRKYNIWDKDSLPEGFRREKYLSRIVKYLNNNLIKVIIGQRRSGKSYFLRQIMNYLVHNQGVERGNIFYLNKEFIEFEEIRTAQDLHQLFNQYLQQLQPEGRVYIFLDEVQNIENWEKFVNSYSQNYVDDYEIFITGSNSKLLSSELSSLLSGRFVEFNIYPFSYQEFIEFYGLEKNKSSYLKYLQTSGLPETFRLSDDEVKQHYIEDLKNTIILKDIILRYKLKDSQLLEDLFKFLATNTGNLTSVNSIVKYFKSLGKKTNYETVSDYINYLTETFVFHSVERYNLRGKTVLAGNRKFYLNDLGFKNYLFGFSPVDLSGNLENLVLLQLLFAGYQVYVGKFDNCEIDFVAIKNDKPIYLQVAVQLSDENVVQREYGNLLKIKDNYPKYVVSLDDIQFSDYQGIKHVQAWKLDEVLNI